MNRLSNPVGWFGIFVDNLNRAKVFCETVIANHLQDLPSGNPTINMLMFSGIPNEPSACRALIKHPMKKSSTEGTLVYFSCSDCAVQVMLAIEIYSFE